MNPIKRPRARSRSKQLLVVLSSLVLSVGGAGPAVHASVRPTAAAAQVASMQDVVPVPVKVEPATGADHTITSDTAIYTQTGSAGVGDYLAALLRRSTGYPLPVKTAPGTPADGISLLLTGADPSVGDQGYQLDVTTAAVVVRANKPAGLFAGVQTLRQLLPAAVESTSTQPGPWVIPGGRIVDYPRFAYRGSHLDVARHFFTVDEVKRYVDEISLYKVNYLHLHLTDDQGWRIQINSWPRLATYGGELEVGGTPGGYYTQDQYRDIVAYAQSRGITVVPEIDMPGHTNAALASYAELNCNNTAPPRRTDIEVGYSSLCISKDVTYKFVADVIREVAALTPGPYLHIGGDEASATPQQDYITFLNKVLPLVQQQGKIAMGWHDIVNATPPTSAVPQYWGTETSHGGVQAAAKRGNKILMSPANKSYLDMKYNSSTRLGLSWAGFIEVQTAYEWNPGSHLSGVTESQVFGVEAPLWSETLLNIDDIEFMAFPRLPAIAELGWSPQSTHNWNAFRQRLAAQGPRWQVMGVDFYRSSQVPWKTDNPGPPGKCSESAWDPSATYTGGQKVSYNDHTWTARWWTHGDTPGNNSQDVWTDNGPC
ncbi:family 20 glycosylhydrolase [Actinomadura decatromicini]|uniref:beta-N-acetylhexosaminidase n=1 Tax=Actinomadura decatromicini TaxID=2604572 RepID=A0A5D3FQD3_9ACTN|nr:family 20 glycosylhydrolase [Actinomadura decatromicini]TYK51027.1 family 20 glycosylhydrolase [Actinomadura decatromicini]